MCVSVSINRFSFYSQSHFSFFQFLVIFDCILDNGWPVLEALDYFISFKRVLTFIFASSEINVDQLDLNKA